MAGNSLLVLIDDIATLLDDVAAMSKVAGKKTAGIIGDDLALNAQQVTGINTDRELPVVWAVAKGSMLNKAILVPAALLISAFIPWLITPLLIIGGLFLCFEGIEKLAHSISKKAAKIHHDELVEALNNPDTDMLAFEKEKIKGAIRTDFILSAEIIAISLGVVADAPLITQAGVLTTIAILITIIVYGLVAGIVRLDDWGLALHQRQGDSTIDRQLRRIGYGILQIVPYLMKGLSVLGTAAMFLVGGGILTHGIPLLHHGIEYLSQFLATLPGIGSFISSVGMILIDGLVGMLAGLIIFLIVDNFFHKKE